MYSGVISHTMLFHKKSQKVIKFLFTIVGALIILSMVLLYAPGLLNGGANVGY